MHTIKMSNTVQFPKKLDEIIKIEYERHPLILCKIPIFFDLRSCRLNKVEFHFAAVRWKVLRSGFNVKFVVLLSRVIMVQSWRFKWVAISESATNFSALKL